MSDITTIEPTAKRERNGTLLTDRLCETRPDTRKKYTTASARAIM